MEDLANYITTAELARLAGVTQPRIRQLVAAGEIPAVKLAGRWLIHRKDAERWLEERRRRKQQHTT